MRLSKALQSPLEIHQASYVTIWIIMVPLHYEQSIHSLERGISSARLLVKERLIKVPAFYVRLPKSDVLLHIHSVSINGAILSIHGFVSPNLTLVK